MAKQEIRSWFSHEWQTARKWVSSEQVRRYRTWVFQAYVIIALLAFAALALLASMFTYFNMDVHITRELQAELPAWMGVVMQAVSWPGYTLPSIAITLLVVVCLGLFGLRWEALAALFAASSSLALNTVIKVAIRRPRPTADLVEVFQQLNSYSFPSGHTMYYMAFYGFLLFLTFILAKKSWRKRLVMLVLALLIGLVGLSRMYLGEHWASDVIGGYLLGSLVLILSIEYYRWGKVRFFVDQPVAPTERPDLDYPEPDARAALPHGAKIYEHNLDRAESRPASRRKPATHPVPETGRARDRDRKPGDD